VEEEKNVFPERLRKLREKQHRKQYAVAHLCGLDRKTLRRYEKGEIEPLMTQLVVIAEYFGVSVDYLTGRTDNPEINK